MVNHHIIQWHRKIHYYGRCTTSRGLQCVHQGQSTLADASETMYGKDVAEEFGLKWQTQDMSKVTEYCKHFLALGNALDSCYTLIKIRCFDVLELQERCKYGWLFDGISILSTWDNRFLCFKVKDGCQKHVYAKNGTGHVKYQFIWEAIDVYNSVVCKGWLIWNLSHP